MTCPVESWSYDVVSALVYSLAVRQVSALPVGSGPPYNDLTQFVLEQQRQMPDYLRAPMRAATLGFDSFGLFRAGRLFHDATPAVRQKQISAWRKSRLSFERDLVRYYESLATLALHSRTAAPLDSDNSEKPIISPAPDSERVLWHPPGTLNSEIVVIGSGPGGAITACLLAEAGCRVLLIEEGPYYSLESCRPFSREEMLQKYRNGGQTVALGRNKVAYVEGRCVGGGSEINSGLYHRTPPEILEQWSREFQVEALAEEELLAHFEECEKELSVSFLPEPAPAASLKLRDGATRLGWKALEVPRWFRYSGGTAESGTRQSMTQTFVPRFLRAGGQLLPGTRVKRLRQESGGWQLMVEHTSGSLQISAETLFVCGGAVQTPLLLRRSGIEQNVGNSLRLHPTVKVVATFAEAVNAADMGVPVHQVKEFAPRMSFGCSISTQAYFALGLIDHSAALQKLTADWEHMANYYAMIAADGRGTVRPIPGYRDALVRYQLTLQDRRDLGQGLRRLCEVLFASQAVALYPGITGQAELGSRDDLAKLPDMIPEGMTNLMTIHLFSSCPMGEDKSKCATDSFGRMHGFKNLFIADASLLCGPPGVNPQGSIMALARRNALHFLDYSGKSHGLGLAKKPSDA